MRQLPDPLPQGFIEQLRYPFDRRLLGVYYASDQVALTDGVNTWTSNDRHEGLEQLFSQPGFAPWLAEHDVDLGSSLGPPKHWLLIDRLTNQGYVPPARAARDKVRTQRLDE